MHQLHGRTRQWWYNLAKEKFKDRDESWFEHNYCQGNFLLDEVVSSMASTRALQRDGKQELVTMLFSPVMIWSSQPLTDFRLPDLDTSYREYLPDGTDFTLLSELKSAHSISELCPIDMLTFLTTVAGSLLDRVSTSHLYPVDHQGDIHQAFDGYLSSTCMVSFLSGLPMTASVRLQASVASNTKIAQLIRSDLKRRYPGIETEVIIYSPRKYQLLSSAVTFANFTSILELLPQNMPVNSLLLNCTGWSRPYKRDYALIVNKENLMELSAPELLPKEMEMFLNDYRQRANFDFRVQPPALH